MLIIAALLLGLALLLWLVDKWLDNADVDHALPGRILVFVSGALIGLNFYMQGL